jgi:hypothetical protein
MIAIGRFQVLKIETILLARDVTTWNITLRVLTGDAIDGQIVIAIADPTIAAKFTLGQIFTVGLNPAEK